MQLETKRSGQTRIGTALLRRPYSVGYVELGYLHSDAVSGTGTVIEPCASNFFRICECPNLENYCGWTRRFLRPHNGQQRHPTWRISNFPACLLIYKDPADPLAEEIALGHWLVIPPPSVVHKALDRLHEIRCMLERDDRGNDGQKWRRGDNILVANSTPIEFRETNPLLGTGVVVGSIVLGVLLMANYIYIKQKRKKADSAWIIRY